MNRKRTKKEKLRTQNRRQETNSNLYSIDPKILKSNDKSVNKQNASSVMDFSYMKLDLTKTLVLTMLVLALEIVIWKLLARQ